MKYRETVVKQISRFFYHYRLFFLLLSLTFSIGCIIGLKKIDFNGDVAALYALESDEFKNFVAVEQEIRDQRNIVFILSPADKNIFTKSYLQVDAFITDELEKLDMISSVVSFKNFQRISAKNDEIDVEALYDDITSLSENQLADIRYYMTQESGMAGDLVSSTGDVGIIVAAVNSEEYTTAMSISEYAKSTDRKEDLDKIDRAAIAAREIKSKVKALHSDMEIYLTGLSVEINAFRELSKQELLTFGPIVFFLSALCISVLFRSVAAVLAISSLVLLSTLSAMGIMCWQGLSFNLFTIAAPCTVVVIALADSIHLLTNFFQHIANGSAKDEAMMKAIEINLMPIFLTSMTTIIGILSLNYTDTPMIVEFANLAAAGVIIAFVFTMTYLPSLILFFDFEKNETSNKFNTVMMKLGRFVIDNRFFCLSSMAVLIVFSLTFLHKNYFNDSLLVYFDDSTEFRQAMEFAGENMQGALYIDYLFDSGEENGVFDPKFLQKIDEFANWYEAKPQVLKTSSYLSSLKEMNYLLHGSDENWRVIPESKELASQYQLLYDMAIDSSDLPVQFHNNDFSKLKLHVPLKNISSPEFFEIYEDADRKLKSSYPEIYSEGTGISVLLAQQGALIFSKCLESLPIVILLITISITLGLRSVLFGTLSLIPNIFPALVVFGLWGLFIREINQASVIVFIVTVGLVVDDTVHFLTKYLFYRQQGENAEEAILKTFTAAG